MAIRGFYAIVDIDGFGVNIGFYLTQAGYGVLYSVEYGYI